MAWIFLLIAGLFEVAWAVGLKQSNSFTRLYPSIFTVASMLLSVYFLSVASKTLPMGTAYAIWTGIGAVGVVVLGMVFWGFNPYGDKTLYIFEYGLVFYLYHEPASPAGRRSPAIQFSYIRSECSQSHFYIFFLLSPYHNQGNKKPFHRIKRAQRFPALLIFDIPAWLGGTLTVSDSWLNLICYFKIGKQFRPKQCTIANKLSNLFLRRRLIPVKSFTPIHLDAPFIFY